jgi:predicted AAA+ superfamily ATPase
MTNLLQTLLVEFQDKMSRFTGGVARELKFPASINKIMVAIGMRRTGKTYFLFQLIQNLLKEIPITRILYINFDDERLLPMGQKDFGQLIDAFYTLYPENHDQQCYLFFDEIQNVDQWERVIRRYFDTKKVKIYLTGSSAKLLSKEIHTSLRGRSFPIEIWPFSYDEFLRAKEVEVPRKLLGKKNLDQLKRFLSLFIEQGGFPESVILANAKNFIDRRSLLQNYVSTVILRDIIERYNLANASMLHYMVKTLLRNVGCGFSVSKFFNDLKSQGLAISKDSLYSYLDYISDSYLAFTVLLYDESIRKKQTNPRKIYAVDTGLVRAHILNRAQNTGHHFENLIYLDLRRARYEEICYYLTKSRKEVDFMARDGLGQWHLYQVCWDMNDQETMQRETLALKEAEKELGIKGKIITPDTYFTDFLPSIRQERGG